MKKNANKGFSLVELIIVIAIMAVLIGVLAPQFIKYVEKSKEAKDITNLDTCVEAVKIYYADKDFPAGGVTITAAKGSPLASTNGQDALKDAGCENSIITGSWSEDISAKVEADGKVTYGGKAKYYESDGTNGFKEPGKSTSTGTSTDSSTSGS